jgi:cytochrome c oxidase subunit 2
VQSALDPAGEEAGQVVILFWVMATGGALIWLAVISALLYATRRGRRQLGEKSASGLILWAGAVFPSVTLLLLLSSALWLMPGLRPFAARPDATLRIEVTAEQYWWRVVYHAAGRPPVVSANEVRLPVGARVEFTLTTDDVIHSFWIPSLGGKMDMLPGRRNRLSLLAEKPGTFRGPCTEYCGTSHALMAFSAVAMEPEAFAAWLDGQARPSPAAAAEGAAVFHRNGCGACHRIDGTPAQGAIGPDLSHLGSRNSVGAGILENTEQDIARFIAAPDAIKPGVGMPAFGMLPEEDIRAIASYLKALQ